MTKLRFYKVRSIENGAAKLHVLKAESEEDVRSFGFLKSHEIISIVDMGPVIQKEKNENVE